MCCFLAASLLKYAYTCVHNVRYICNVIKICLTLMASKYAQFPSVCMCTHILLMTSLGNCAYFDAINVKHILMTLQI